MKESRIYRTREGKEPFTQWVTSLNDKTVLAQIANRLDRAIHGNYGDHKLIGNGIYELRIHCKSGYRIYFIEQEQTVILLLLGGSKKTQNKDIQKAKKYWKELRERSYD